MAPRERTGVGIPLEFTDHERTRLVEILKVRNRESALAFLKDVEDATAHYRADYSALTPPESPVRARRLLVTVFEQSKTLRDAMDQLDWAGSFGLLLSAAALQGCSFNADEMMKNLSCLQTSAEKVLRDWLDVQRGRPYDWIELIFVTRIVREYQRHFGKLPPHSPGSSFSVFIAEMLKKLAPDSPHICRDNSKFLKTAIANACPRPVSSP